MVESKKETKPEPKFKAGQIVWVEIVFADAPKQISYERHKVKIYKDKAVVCLFGSGEPDGFGLFDTVTGEFIGRLISSISSIKLLLDLPQDVNCWIRKI